MTDTCFFPLVSINERRDWCRSSVLFYDQRRERKAKTRVGDVDVDVDVRNGKDPRNPYPPLESRVWTNPYLEMKATFDGSGGAGHFSKSPGYQ
jgi:hypothetical protein